jgi:hypothetical protein
LGKKIESKSFEENNESTCKLMNINFEDQNITDPEILQFVKNDKNYPLFVKFDFQNRDEINGLLSSYMIGNFTNNQRNNFISQVLSNYSDILYTSYSTLKEIRELDMVKYALHFKYKKLRKLNTDLEAEIEDLKRFGETNKTIKDILIKQKCDVEIKYNDSISQLIIYKEEIKVNKLIFMIFNF